MHRLSSLLAVLCLTALSSAQMTMTQNLFRANDFTPGLRQTDVEAIVRAIGLAEVERTSVLDLYTAHVARVEEEGNRLRTSCADLVERVQLLGDGAPFAELSTLQQEWDTRRGELDKEFLVELRLLLTQEQDERWPVVERELRRIRHMPTGRLCGESSDAIVLVDALTIPRTPEVTQAMDRYARSLDTAIRARSSALSDYENDERDLLEADPKAAARLFDRIRAARVEIRDLTHRTITEVATLLDARDADRLHRAYRDALAAPFDLRNSVTRSVLDGALGLSSLTPDQRAAITNLKEAHDRDVDQWIEEYLEIVFRFEESVVPDPLTSALTGAPPAEPQWSMTSRRTERFRYDPIRRAWEARLQIDKQARASALAMLDRDQRASIPIEISGATLREGELYGTGDYFQP
jgi:hypothetical protein